MKKPDADVGPHISGALTLQDFLLYNGFKLTLKDLVVLRTWCEKNAKLDPDVDQREAYTAIKNALHVLISKNCIQEEFPLEKAANTVNLKGILIDYQLSRIDNKTLCTELEPYNKNEIPVIWEPIV